VEASRADHDAERTRSADSRDDRADSREAAADVRELQIDMLDRWEAELARVVANG